MNRQPVVAGRFYDANIDKLNAMVDGFLGLTEEKRPERTVVAMVPHAGYVFSGAVCGKTLSAANLESTLLLLGPNHTGRGDAFSLWPEGAWDIPGARIPVDEELAATLLDAEPLVTANTTAHIGEHSLEVLLPFLYRLNPDTAIVPIAISAHSFEHLAAVGTAIGVVLKAFQRPVSIVVSSDMSHYISDDDARRKDKIALDAALSLEPRALFSAVRQHEISMCGVLPMTTSLFAARQLGATKGELIAYATSGEVSGDFDKVVGYAGVVVS